MVAQPTIDMLSVRKEDLNVEDPIIMDCIYGFLSLPYCYFIFMSLIIVLIYIDYACYFIFWF